MSKRISIAIDGPAAAGKSTVAKIIAEKLGYIYIDTGAMYRAITLKVLEHNNDPSDNISVTSILKNTDIELQNNKSGQRVILDGVDVTENVRKNDVTNVVSLIAAIPEVREAMLIRQRKLGELGGVVMDGRDIGTHVLPNAEVKIFLIASVEERAVRRHKENIERGFISNLEELKIEIAKRDELDSTREVAPLTKAKDAIEIDTTSKSLEEVVDAIMEVVKVKI
ncbi:MAG: cytidylate kinase [Bacillales bacterium]|jgi:cytidylate kinase|nr:cytidylate kinase [Bacillales bacterium]